MAQGFELRVESVRFVVQRLEFSVWSLRVVVQGLHLGFRV